MVLLGDGSKYALLTNIAWIKFVWTNDVTGNIAQTKLVGKIIERQLIYPSFPAWLN